MLRQRSLLLGSTHTHTGGQLRLCLVGAVLGRSCAWYRGCYEGARPTVTETTLGYSCSCADPFFLQLERKLPAQAVACSRDTKIPRA